MNQERRQKELSGVVKKLVEEGHTSLVDFSGLGKKELKFVLNGYIDGTLKRKEGVPVWDYEDLRNVAERIGRIFTPDERLYMAKSIIDHIGKSHMHPNDQQKEWDTALELLEGLEKNVINSCIDRMGRIHLGRALKSLKGKQGVLEEVCWPNLEVRFHPYSDLNKAMEFFKQSQNTTGLMGVGGSALRGVEYLIRRALYVDVLKPVGQGYDLVLEAYDGSATPKNYVALVKDLLQTHPQVSSWRQLKGVPDIEPTIVYVRDERPNAPESDEPGIPSRNRRFYKCDESESFAAGRAWYNENHSYMIRRNRFTLQRDDFTVYLDKLEQLRTEKGRVALERITDPEVLGSTIDSLEKSRRLKEEVNLPSLKERYFELVGDPQFGKFVAQFR